MPHHASPKNIKFSAAEVPEAQRPKKHGRLGGSRDSNMTFRLQLVRDSHAMLPRPTPLEETHFICVFFVRARPSSYHEACAHLKYTSQLFIGSAHPLVDHLRLSRTLVPYDTVHIVFLSPRRFGVGFSRLTHANVLRILC